MICIIMGGVTGLAGLNIMCTDGNGKGILCNDYTLEDFRLTAKIC